MILNHPVDDEDLKFVIYYKNRSASFVKSETLSLEADGSKITELNQIISWIFQLYGEEPSDKKIAEFKRVRQAPTEMKGDVSVITLINYINIVKQMLKTGQLKNKDYIDDFTKKLDIKFDPDFYLLEIKTGLITEINEAEGMDKLFCENVRADRDYFICSGLREVYKKEDLLGNTYLFVLNIKKVKFKALESEGMICCASSGGSVEAIKVDAMKNTRLELEDHLQMFENLVFEKVDLKKAKYTAAIGYFKIIDHHLTFKGCKVKCGGEYVKTSMKEGEVH